MIFKILFIKWILFSGRGYAGDAELVISDRFSPGHGQRGGLRPGADTGRVVGQIVIEIYLFIVKLIYDIGYTFMFIRYSYYICSSRETPARTHLEGLALVLRLKVQIYVGPLCLVL